MPQLLNNAKEIGVLIKAKVFLEAYGAFYLYHTVLYKKVQLLDKSAGEWDSIDTQRSRVYNEINLDDLVGNTHE
jgi:hypothetical protein